MNWSFRVMLTYVSYANSSTSDSRPPNGLKVCPVQGIFTIESAGPTMPPSDNC